MHDMEAKNHAANLKSFNTRLDIDYPTYSMVISLPSYGQDKTSIALCSAILDQNVKNDNYFCHIMLFSASILPTSNQTQIK